MDNGTRNVNEIVWREDLYPRMKSSPKLVQEYADNLSVLPPIEINQKNEIIDGYHRWIAHRAKEQNSISVFVTTTSSDGEVLELAIERNSVHGFQLSYEDKKVLAQKIYTEAPIEQQVQKKEYLQKLLSVSHQTVYNWLKKIDEDQKLEKLKYIYNLWMAGYTPTDIEDKTNKSDRAIRKDVELFQSFELVPNVPQNCENPTDVAKTIAYFQDEYERPLYDIWNYGKKTNEVEHYGNTEVRIVENLLYLYTEPFEMVIDPFAGGGSTIDACYHRMRRYWVSDRKPIVARENEIRSHNLIDPATFDIQISGPYHWKDVALVYLDPPYWKQAAGKYSDDPTDLANMTLENFTKYLVAIIQGYAKKLRPGAKIACIISPTQWPNEDKHTDYHDLDLAQQVGGELSLTQRIICPYSTQQYNGTQVDIAKEKKLIMPLSRTMLVWEKK